MTRTPQYRTGVTYRHAGDDWAPAADHGPQWHATAQQTSDVAAQLRALGYVDVVEVTR